MEQILTVFNEILQGGNNETLLNFENINVIFTQGRVNVYDQECRIPYGRYKMPQNEKALKVFLDKMSKLIKKVEDNGKYICGKCNEILDLPEAYKDKYGNLLCSTCRGSKVTPPAPEQSIDLNKDQSTVRKSGDIEPIASPNLQKALEILKRSNEYKIKKIVKSYKIVFQDELGRTDISKKFYKSKEEFDKSNEDQKFKAISIVKELFKKTEEDLD